MANTLVIYYSRKGENYMPGGLQVLEKGHTERAAEFIANALGADIFEIDTVNPYNESYRGCCMQAAQETKDNARPEIKAYLESVSSYDNIFVCYPCWCGTAPMCIFTFLDNYDLNGKKLIPLSTHEGSGLARSVEHLTANYPSATVAAGIAIYGHKVAASEEEIVAWAKSQI